MQLGLTRGVQYTVSFLWAFLYGELRYHQGSEDTGLYFDVANLH